MENTTAVDVADGLDELEKKALLLVAEAVDIIKIEVGIEKYRVDDSRKERQVKKPRVHECRSNEELQVGNLLEKPPSCYLNESKEAVVQFAKFMIWAMKDHTNMYNLLIGKSPDYNGHSSGTFLMNLLELIMKEEAAKKTQLTGPDLELHIQNATEMVPAFSRNGHEVYMDVKTWIKNSYETHMKTVVGRYMEMNCMSPSFKSFGTGWLTSVYNARSILWEDSPFQRRSPFKTVAAVELQSDEDLLVN
ncbi:unnamed protein product [Notodromas monacha]|uniref:Uncharacterized protein n=1 Tax=Notodromas monacha TaxID=399045 RepID=A0A7R9BRS1_9CRUS|nr:unnamed protein product [Notodromas monacha]CAG0919130.1 unnamed protein product [Notodromas monacha]